MNLGPRAGGKLAQAGGIISVEQGADDLPLDAGGDFFRHRRQRIEQQVIAFARHDPAKRGDDETILRDGQRPPRLILRNTGGKPFPADAEARHTHSIRREPESLLQARGGIGAVGDIFGPAAPESGGT